VHLGLGGLDLRRDKGLGCHLAGLDLRRDKGLGCHLRHDYLGGEGVQKKERAKGSERVIIIPGGDEEERCEKTRAGKRERGRNSFVSRKHVTKGRRGVRVEADFVCGVEEWSSTHGLGISPASTADDRPALLKA
jgi:hypothetical protein